MPFGRELGWYILAFIPVGLSVMKEAWEGLLNKDYFNEFTLMTIASIGAFFIGECPIPKLIKIGEQHMPL